MGYVQLEEFSLMGGVTRAQFKDLDAQVQAWSYLHLPRLVRRTTAFAGSGDVLVVTLLGGSEPPGEPRVTGELAAALAEAIDDATYRRVVYRDLD